MSKQTAVEWLQERLLLSLSDELKSLNGFFVIAKEMEKEQIKEAYMSALPYGLEYSHYDKFANKYYNEIYKKEEK
jgi:hypothetical protein